jgi:hypothetical protein
MNKQFNTDRLCEKLMLEEFRYWNYNRVSVGRIKLDELKKNITDLRTAITETLANRHYSCNQK